MRHFNTSELEGEERFEAEAAFGRNADLVRLEPWDLVPTKPKKYPIEDVLDEGDYFEYRTRSGKIIAGTVTEVESYAVSFDRDTERCGIGCGYVGFDSFGGDKGLMLELVSVNGESVDVDYEPIVADDCEACDGRGWMNRDTDPTECDVCDATGVSPDSEVQR